LWKLENSAFLAGLDRRRTRLHHAVAGDVRLGHNLFVTLDTDSDLDLVAGSFFTTGRVFGSPKSPMRTRLWVG
jgi:hypothetical protein